MYVVDDFTTEIIIIGGSLLSKQVNDVCIYKYVPLFRMLAKHLCIEKGRLCSHSMTNVGIVDLAIFAVV